ncbi:MAG: DNA binding protein, nucleoid-associated [Betaproteobacteria bacterium ADurb.Bin341]|nr:MAG: DNA binding protein, nucleoid-associated [Betaproteobacteria bacterium ADurb.Bin341]
MDISGLSLVELIDLQKRIPAEIKRREAKEKNALLGRVKKMVADHGFSLEDLLVDKGSSKAKTRAPVKVKYRHPKDASLTWTGRGRTPKWVEQWKTSGGKLEQLLVSN